MSGSAAIGGESGDLPTIGKRRLKPIANPEPPTKRLVGAGPEQRVDVGRDLDVRPRRLEPR